MSVHHVSRGVSPSRDRAQTRKTRRPSAGATPKCPTAGPRRSGGRPARINPARLEAMEDLLFEAVLEYHPNRPAARARLGAAARRADGPDGGGPRRGAPPRLPAAPSPAWLDRIERRLVAAVLDHHPNHDRALDRLLADVESAQAEEERERAEYDMRCDNDPDGLG